MNEHYNKILNQVSQIHDEKQAELLKPILISFVWKFYIAQYHADESKDIILRLISQPSKEEYIEVVKLIFENASGSDKGKQFRIAIFKAEANMIAYAQSIHSLGDIFAQIIYISLNLDQRLKKPIPLQLRTISKINETITNIPEYRRLHSELNSFLKSGQFKYLNAYVNTTKHRSLIPVNYSVSFTERIEPIHGLKIEGFSYNNDTFKTKYSNELIEDNLKYFEETYKNIQNELSNCIV